MTLDNIMKYMGHGIALRAVELVEEDTEEGGASEYQIDTRIDAMTHDEIVEGVAQGFLLMKEHPDIGDLEEAEYEEGAETLFEEIHEFLEDRDLGEPDEE